MTSNVDPVVCECVRASVTTRFNFALEPFYCFQRAYIPLSDTVLSLCFNLLRSKMVQLTISAAPKYTARGLPLTIDVTPEATVGDVKTAVAANFSKVCTYLWLE